MRFVICSLLLGALVADVFVARQTMHNEHEYFVGGLAGVVLAIALAAALCGRSIRAHVFAAAVALFVWLGAAVAGFMFASCDPAMRPIIVPLIALLVSVPFVASGAVFIAVPISVGAGWIGGRVFPAAPSWLTYVVVIAAGVVIAMATYSVATLLGARPTPTACVV